MKKIAVTGRLDLNASYHEVREGLDINWSLMFDEMGILPIFIPVEIEAKKYFTNLDIDGILLTGGNDLASCSRGELSEKRDAQELDIISYAVENKIPIVGVCRGMQIIAEYFNCTFQKIAGHVAIEHGLVVDQKSRFLKHLNSLDKVNAFHNFAVDTVPDELLVSATDEMGVIKAIEHKELPIFAQMWHPERVSPFSQAEMSLISQALNWHDV